MELLLSKERILKDHALQISLKQRALQVQKPRKQNGKRESSHCIALRACAAASHTRAPVYTRTHIHARAHTG